VKFVAKTTSYGRFRFNMVASNGRVVATGESYTRKNSALKASLQNGGSGIVDDETRRLNRRPSGTASTSQRRRANHRDAMEGVRNVSDGFSRESSPSAASTSDLVSQAAAQISTLVRDELALAKLELTEKGKRAGIGGGLFGGAAVLGLYGLGLLLALAVVLLDLVWPLWLALLVVLVVVLAAAGVAALLGKQKLTAAMPPVPSDAVASAQADVRTVKGAVREGHSS
jgi:uncharacterized protein YegP (UPF0339 family)/uncharacterized membrane protein YqjE